MHSIAIDTVVTGGTGLIGRWLLIELTSRGRNVGALVRRRAQIPRLRDWVNARGGDARRLKFFEGDLTGFAFPPERWLDSVRDVFHLAARFSFGLSREQAAETNVVGTLRLTRWAERAPGLRRFVHLGGFRATQMPEWLERAAVPLSARVRDRLYSQFGGYEASKLESVLRVRELMRRGVLPATIVHPATVIGDSTTGETTQLVGLAETIERLWAGKLPALVGTADTWLPLVTVDYLARFLAAVPDNPATAGQQLTVMDERTPVLPELVTDIAGHLGVKAPSRVVSRSVVRALPRALTGVHREALSFLTEDTDYPQKDARDHAECSELELPDLDRAVAAWCDHLVSTRFGRDAEAPAGSFRDVAGSRAFCRGNPSTADRVLLHGLPWDGTSWRALAAELCGEAAYPDLPGLGRSEPSRVDAPEWIESLLAERAGPVELIGHSLGAGLAVEYARAHPERVARLVLISPHFLQRRAPWLFRRSLLVSLGLRYLTAAGLQKRMLSPKHEPDPVAISSCEQLRRPGVARRTAAALTSASSTSTRQKLREILLSLDVPVLIVVGDSDPLERDLPDRFEVRTIEGTGHNPHIERPEQVAAAIARNAAKQSIPMSITMT